MFADKLNLIVFFQMKKLNNLNVKEINLIFNALYQYNLNKSFCLYNKTFNIFCCNYFCFKEYFSTMFIRACPIYDKEVNHSILHCSTINRNFIVVKKSHWLNPNPKSFFVAYQSGCQVQPMGGAT